MAAIDIALGMAGILYNVFSHISDGSNDDGAIHWVVESPMQRGKKRLHQGKGRADRTTECQKNGNHANIQSILAVDMSPAALDKATQLGADVS
eukprot:scaffold3575_cov153-Chaetoceros_neogracile.AAC.4